MFEDDICVDLSGVSDRKPNYANVPLAEHFATPCVSRLEVLDGGPDYATALISEYIAKAGCPPVLAPSRVTAVEVYD